MNKVSAILSAVAFTVLSAPVMAYENVTPSEAYNLATSDPNVVILDVRTREEWGFVGHPAPNAIGDGAALTGKVFNISIQVENNGQMVPNKWFLDDVKEKFKDNPNVTIITMCRSGHRSAAAAEILEQAGLNVLNMSTGFEGGKDMYGYRTQTGWANEGLPYLKDCDGNGYIPRSVPLDALKN